MHDRLGWRDKNTGTSFNGSNGCAKRASQYVEELAGFGHSCTSGPDKPGTFIPKGVSFRVGIATLGIFRPICTRIKQPAALSPCDMFHPHFNLKSAAAGAAWGNKVAIGRAAEPPGGVKLKGAAN